MLKTFASLFLVFILSTQLFLSAATAVQYVVAKDAKPAVLLQHQYLCILPTGEAIMSGSSFPIDSRHLITAAHMKCPEGTINIVDTNRGYLVEAFPLKIDVKNDIMLIELRSANETVEGPFARFRSTPKIGEHVSAYGSALFGEIETGFYMEGVVQGFAPWVIFTSANIAPGMSGSALVGDDGKVIGMNIFAMPTFLAFGAIPWGVVAGAVPSQVIVQFLQQ